MNRHESTGSEPARFGPLASTAIVLAVTVAVALATVLVVLARAGADPANNWPTTYNLLSSDNGVLFEVARDVFHGVTLDWSFSPQVYMFPEIPISLIAYALVGGALEAYFLVVAVLNVSVLFLVVFALSRALRPAGLGQSLARAVIALSPLLALPLLAHQSIYLFHLAATYYYGMYLLGLALPLALVSPHRLVRVVVVVLWALTGAANPLLFAMSLPGLALLALLLLIRPDRRQNGLLPALAWVGGALALAIAVRAIAFNPIAGTDPGSYISVERAQRRMHDIVSTLRTGFDIGLDTWLFALTVAALVVCSVFFVRSIRDVLRGPSPRQQAGRIALGSSYLTSLPFLGAIAMTAILAVHVYYLWFAIVGAIVVVALLAPRPRLTLPLAAALSILVLTLASVGIAQGNYADGRYFGFQSALSRCVDAAVPGQIGYSTFSDARPVSLTSRAGIKLIAINTDLSPNFWLTNRSYSKELVGTFILVNPDTAEAPLPEATILAEWGSPSTRIACGTAEVWTYPTVSQQRRLAAWFAGYAALR